MIKNQKNECSICKSKNLTDLIDLPGLPLTGIYIKPDETKKFPEPDQIFQLCNDCGHGQLKNILNPSLVYDDTYTHRSSASPIATSGNDFFANFLNQFTEGKQFNRILEIGCNDLYLLRKLAPVGKARFGLDPIFKNNPPSGLESGLHAIGKFVEELDLKQDLGGSPDLVISCHAFEHIENPREPLQFLMNAVDEGTLFVIEVPGFDSLLSLRRFDQVFHQHIHYYSLASFERLIRELGGEYVAHNFNYSYWGGTMMMAFRKTSKTDVKKRFAAPTANLVKNKFQEFKQLLQLTKNSLEEFSKNQEPVYGFGAAQMLPILAKHLDSRLDNFTGIIDDNPDRVGMRYPNFPVEIIKSDKINWDKANVMITALDSTRPILKRLIELKPKRIIHPLNLF